MRPLDDIEMDFLQGGMTAPLLLELAEHVHDNAKAKGFWDKPDMKLVDCLLASEVVELLESMRRQEPQESEKIPAFMEAEEELADIIIRALDSMEHTRESRATQAMLLYSQALDRLKTNMGKLFANMIANAAKGHRLTVASWAISFAHREHLRLWPAVFAKHRYNLTRPRLHGKRF